MQVLTKCHFQICNLLFLDLKTCDLEWEHTSHHFSYQGDKAEGEGGGDSEV